MAGSEAENLPAYVVMPDSHGAQEAGVPMYTNGFLPSVYQPTMFRPGNKPVLNLDLPKGVTPAERHRSIALLKDLNKATMVARIRNSRRAWRLTTLPSECRPKRQRSSI